MLRAALASLLLAVSSTAVAPPDPTASLFEPMHDDTRAVLLVVDGKVVQKHYVPGYSDANRFISWSMAKSVTAMLVGALVADGKLQLDAPAPVAEWKNDARGQITLRQLLNMSSGIRHIEVGTPIENSDTNQVLFVSGTADMAARAIARPLAFRPGTHFQYDSLTSLLLAEIVTRTLTSSRDPHMRAEAYRRFAEDRLFRPAGVTSAFLEFDGAGTQIGGSIIHMNLPDWARLGRLLIDGKSESGMQVIAPQWLAFMKTPAPTNPRYGGQIWLSKNGLVSMRGHLGQFVFAGRKGGHTAILVRLGNTREDKLESLVPVYERITDQALTTS
ncbi:MAG: serine hydrolase [Proteobacteria bacterium]|nr:serine hydrolase [Pseudomonadota bacterium]